MEKLYLGNCLVGAIVLWFKYGGKIVLQLRNEHNIFSVHFVVRCNDRKARHFHVKKSFLPKPLTYLLFWGVFEEYGV